MGPALTILIAEDDPADADLFRIALRRAGINDRVLFVNDGEEAIEYIQGKGRFADREKFPFPKIVISDVKMPRRTGLELLDWLRAHPDCKILPTVLVSGSGLEMDVRRAYGLGANSYFQKPSTLDELTSLARVLNDYWSRTELPLIEKRCE